MVYRNCKLECHFLRLLKALFCWQLPLVKKYGGQLILVTTAGVKVSQAVANSAYKVHTDLQVAHAKVKARFVEGQLQLMYFLNPDIRDNAGYINMGGYVNY